MISIIVPIYNTERYLGQCIRSCLMQTYIDLELILVNDASTDSSLDLCKKYAASDPRIYIINKTINEGVEKARFSGLKRARGQYIMFIDSDDWLDDADILRIMYEKAEASEADYVEMGMQRVLDRHKLIKKRGLSPIIGQIKQPELFEKYYISFFGVNILSVNMCGKLYRKKVLDKAEIQPLGLTMGEDLAFNMQLFPYLSNIQILNRVGYNYRFGGMTTRYNPHLLPDLKRLYVWKKALIEKYHYYRASDYIRIELKNVLKSDICQMIIFKIGSSDEIKDRISKELRDPVYQQIMHVQSYPHFLEDPFVRAIAAYDVDTLYSICQQQVKKERPVRLIKQIVSFLFTHL